MLSGNVFQVSFLLMLLIGIPIFLLPTIIAVKRNHAYKVPIILINILGGLLWGIGWVIALIWSFIDWPETRVNTSGSAEEIERLHSLKEKGAITEQEFEIKKNQLLDLSGPDSRSRKPPTLG